MQAPMPPSHESIAGMQTEAAFVVPCWCAQAQVPDDNVFDRMSSVRRATLAATTARAGGLGAGAMELEPVQVCHM